MDSWSMLRKRLHQTFEGSNLNTKIKLTFAEGPIWILDIGQDLLGIREDSKESASCEFRATLAHALDIFNRKLSPKKAMLTLKLKVSGDLGLALKVTELLKRPLPQE